MIYCTHEYGASLDGVRKIKKRRTSLHKIFKNCFAYFIKSKIYYINRKPYEFKLKVLLREQSKLLSEIESRKSGKSG